MVKIEKIHKMSWLKKSNFVLDYHKYDVLGLKVKVSEYIWNFPSTLLNCFALSLDFLVNGASYEAS